MTAYSRDGASAYVLELGGCLASASALLTRISTRSFGVIRVIVFVG